MLKRTICDPQLPAQNCLFDTSNFGYCHTQLTPETMRRLYSGLEGYFRASIRELMPVSETFQVFDCNIGRPIKELHAEAMSNIVGAYLDFTPEWFYSYYGINNFQPYGLMLEVIFSYGNLALQER